MSNDRSTRRRYITNNSRSRDKVNRRIEYPIVVLSVVAFLSAIWIVAPAPAEFIWLFAVAASEWSLLIAILALFSIVASLYLLIFRGGGKLNVFSVVFSSAAFVISIYPFISTLGVARENGTPLSLRRYVAGLKTLGSSDKTDKPSTYIYSQIDGQELFLDVYLPTQANANNGASVIIVHGGAWNGGTRSDFPQWNHRLAEAGFTVIDIDYRLEPQPNYLTATGDVKCAVGWVQQNAGEFNIAPDRMAILGRSAGAHLALLAAYSSGDSRLPSTCPTSDVEANVRAVVSLYAPVNLAWAYDNPANELVIDGKQTLSNFLGGSPHDSDTVRQRYELATPTSHVTTATPPTLIIHGGRDQLVRPENLSFLDQKLTGSNVPHQTLFFPYAQHGFDYNINGWASQVTQQAMLDFLGRHTAVK